MEDCSWLTASFILCLSSYRIQIIAFSVLCFARNFSDPTRHGRLGRLFDLALLYLEGKKGTEIYEIRPRRDGWFLSSICLYWSILEKIIITGHSIRTYIIYTHGEVPMYYVWRARARAKVTEVVRIDIIICFMGGTWLLDTQ